MLIQAEDGSRHLSERLRLYRVAPSPSGWLLVANRVGASGEGLVCLASCAHRSHARQLLAALRRALDSGALSFDFAPLRWTRSCPECRPAPRPAKFPQRRAQVLGGAK